MRSVLSLAIAGVFALVLSAPAHAQTLIYTATLSGSNEAPPVPATGAGGFATITLNLTAQTLDWVVDVYNLPSGVTAGHIHAGGLAVAGPVVVNFTVPTGASNDFRLTGTARPVRRRGATATGRQFMGGPGAGPRDGARLRQRALDGEPGWRDSRSAGPEAVTGIPGSLWLPSPESEDGIDGLKGIFKADLFSLFIRAAVVRDGHLVDPRAHCRHLLGDLRLDAEIT